MNIEDLGNIGEFIAAVATIVTLVYLAIQVQQNTRALKASTFQDISAEMGQNVAPLMMSPDMASIYLKAQAGSAALTNEEKVKMGAVMIASFRRLEPVFVQTQLGSIDKEYAEGFELSLISLVRTEFGAEWWGSSKVLFYKPFVEHVEQTLRTKDVPVGNPAIPGD